MREPTEDSVAAVLAGMPDVVERLLADHTPDPHGRCRACGRAGTGTPYVTSPCSLWTIAEAARKLRALRTAR
jgi:hypothetical protein